MLRIHCNGIYLREHPSAPLAWLQWRLHVSECYSLGARTVRAAGGERHLSRAMLAPTFIVPLRDSLKRLCILVRSLACTLTHSSHTQEQYVPSLEMYYTAS